MAFELPSIPNFTPQPVTAGPSPLDQYGKMLQLRSLLGQQTLLPYQQQEAQQRVQAETLENQQRQLEMKSQQAMMKAWSDPDFLKNFTGTEKASSSGVGFDPDALTGSLISKGVLPKDAMAMTQGFIERSQKVAETLKAQAQTGEANAAIREKGYKTLADSLGGILDAPTAKAGDLFAQLKQELVRNPQKYSGVDQQDLAHVFAADLEHVPAMATVMGLDAKIADFHKSKAEAAKAGTEAEKVQQELPGGQLAPVEQAELQSYLKNPNVDKGVPIAKRDAATFATWKAKQAPLAQLAIAQQAGGGMNQDAVDQAAEYYHLTGKLPPGGKGVAGIAQNRAIMNRAAQLFPGSMAEGTAEYSANKKSLDSLQKNFDQVTAFENTAGKNLDTFLGTAQKVIDAGSPLVNLPLRKAASLAGGTDQAAFNAARTTALTEIAKVLNSSNASGVLSDSARGEVEQLIGPNASLKQIVQAANILKQDMGNRHQAYQDQISDIKRRMGGKPEEKPNSGAGTGAAGGFNWNSFAEHKQ